MTFAPFERLRRYFSSGPAPVPTPRLREFLNLIPDDWDRNKFLLAGSAPLAFRGIRDVGDLDILVHKDLVPHMRQRATPKLASEGYFGSTTHWSIGPHIEIFVKCPLLPLSFEELMGQADRFDGFWVQNPRHSLALKAMAYPVRNKDRADFLSLAQLAANELSVRDGYPYR